MCLCELHAPLSHGVNYLIMSLTESNTGTGSDIGLCVGAEVAEKKREEMDLILHRPAGASTSTSNISMFFILMAGKCRWKPA